MNSVPPRLRPDLEIKKQSSEDGTRYVVKDPVSGEFYRFRRAEYFIARQFDGETPLEVIRERAEAKFGAALAPETLAEFVKVLFKSHLLETGGAAGKKSAGAGRLVQGSTLYLRFKLWDPDRLLTRLVPRLKFFFTPWFMAASGALILLAAGTTFANRYELGADMENFLRPMSIPFVLVVLFALVSLHEFAHGVACKRYGGQVHEMGFMLIYFQPALYCNVSDAWLFPERRQRLWVGFAGPYVEMTLWALATFLWRLTDPETVLHGIALIIAGSAGIKTLLNFNPLLKFDGYYLLTDLIDVPNLRSKSFAYLAAVGRRFFGQPGQERALDVEPRLRRIYVRYGLAAMAFSYAMLAFALLILGDYFIDNRGPVAILIAAALVAARMRSRFTRLFGEKEQAKEGSSHGREASARAEAGSPRGKEKQKEGGAAAAEREGRSLPAVVRWPAYAVGAVVVVALLFALRLELRIAGPFNVLPEENADIRSPLEQIIDEIYVDEGQKVKAGDPIARLDDKPLKAALASTEAAIEEERAILRKLQVGPTQAEIAVARAGVAKGSDSVMYAQRRVERLATLFEQGLVSQKELEDAQEVATTAENNKSEAGSRLHLLQVGTRPEEIAATKAKIDQLEAEKRYLLEQRALLNIISPVGGIVATPTRQLKELRRQLVKKGDLILKVYDMTTVTAQIFVSERELDGIKVGQRVELRARAYPGRSFHGKVTAIATSAQGAAGTVVQPGVFNSGNADPNKSVIVTTLIDNRSLLLKPEMTGQAKVFCGARSIADLIARRAALTFRVALWSWW